MDEKSEAELLAELLVEAYGLTGGVSRLAGESDNFLVTTDDESFVLKLCTASQDSAMLELEHRAVETVVAAGLGLELPRIVPTRRGVVEAALTRDGVTLRGRLLRFVDGVAWNEAGTAGEQRLRHLGGCVAGIVSALETVDHPAARRTHPWDLTAAATHRDKIRHVDDPARRRVVDRAFELFATHGEPYLGQLPHSLIHGDLNDENVLVEGDRVIGVLDFGDCLYNPTICELAIALTYLLLDEADPLPAGAEIVAGYHAERLLGGREIEVLFPLVCGRLAASVSIAAERRRVDPERTAWFVTEERAWRALERYVRTDPSTATKQLSRKER
ncbi:MAG: phosphotransferase [Acidobacteriota bacterium]